MTVGLWVLSSLPGPYLMALIHHKYDFIALFIRSSPPKAGTLLFTLWEANIYVGAGWGRGGIRVPFD